MGNKLRKLEYKLAPYAIHNLMTIMIGAMAIVFVANFAVSAANSELSLYEWLAFDRAMIMKGQIWRLFTFIFLPPDTSLIFIIFALYLYWLMGSALEREWGALYFNLFYITGIIGALISGAITGYATNDFLNLSIFIAFALLYPNFQLYLFFFIPIKIKWLAWLDVLFLAVEFVLGSWGVRLSIVFSLINVLIFFHRDFASQCRRLGMNIKYSWNRWRNQ